MLWAKNAQSRIHATGLFCNHCPHIQPKRQIPTPFRPPLRRGSVPKPRHRKTKIAIRNTLRHHVAGLAIRLQAPRKTRKTRNRRTNRPTKPALKGLIGAFPRQSGEKGGKSNLPERPGGCCAQIRHFAKVLQKTGLPQNMEHVVDIVKVTILRIGGASGGLDFVLPGANPTGSRRSKPDRGDAASPGVEIAGPELSVADAHVSIANGHRREPGRRRSASRRKTGLASKASDRSYSTKVTMPKSRGSHVGSRPPPQFICAAQPLPSLSLS